MTFPLRHKCILMASVFHVVDGGTSLSEIRPFLALLRCRNLPGAFSSRQVEGLEGRDVHGLPLHACSTSFERPASGGGASLPAGPKRGGFFFTRNEPNGRDFRSEATGHEPKGVSSRSMDPCTEEMQTHKHKGRLYIVGPRSGIGRQRRRACRGSAKDGRMRALKEDMDVRGWPWKAPFVGKAPIGNPTKPVSDAPQLLPPPSTTYPSVPNHAPLIFFHFPSRSTTLFTVRASLPWDPQLHPTSQEVKFSMAGNGEETLLGDGSGGTRGPSTWRGFAVPKPRTSTSKASFWELEWPMRRGRRSQWEWKRDGRAQRDICVEGRKEPGPVETSGR